MSEATDPPDARAVGSEVRLYHRPDDLPQPVMDALFPDETILWMQAGRGVRWPLIYTGIPVLQLSVMAFFCWAMVEQDQFFSLENFFSVVLFFGFMAFAFCLIGYVHGRVIFGPATELYLLTDQRVLQCNGSRVRSLVPRAADIERDLLITQLAVWGKRERGWVMLRPDMGRAYRRFDFDLGITSLVGVEHPLEVAAMIKSKLALDIEIEDHTR